MAERFREENGGTRFKEPEIIDCTSDIDFSLDDKPLITENLTAGIDFSLDKDDTEEYLTKDIDFSLPPAEELPQTEDRQYLNKLREIKTYFSKKLSEYTKRDSCLLDAEQLSRLSAPPIFIMGILSAFLFYYVLITFAEAEESVTLLSILICLCAGIVPSFIIIPNTVKMTRKYKIARLIDSELKNYYMDSPYTEDIDYEYTNPYIISELIETEADDIKTAEKLLMSDITDEKIMSLNRKQADSSDSEEIAGRACALCVLGGKII